jgi:hypothetical protein
MGETKGLAMGKLFGAFQPLSVFKLLVRSNP